MSVNLAWAKAPSLIPQAARAALSEEHFALLAGQAAPESTETTGQIRSAEPSPFSNVISSPRVQLMQGPKGVSLFCAAGGPCGLLAFQLCTKVQRWFASFLSPRAAGPLSKKVAGLFPGPPLSVRRRGSAGNLPNPGKLLRRGGVSSALFMRRSAKPASARGTDAPRLPRRKRF